MISYSYAKENSQETHVSHFFLSLLGLHIGRIDTFPLFYCTVRWGVKNGLMMSKNIRSKNDPNGI